MSCRRLLPILIRCLFGLAWASMVLPSAWAEVGTHRALVLDGSRSVVDVWQAATVRFDPTRALTLDGVLAEPAGFGTPPSDFPTFGLRQDTLWMRVPLDVRCQKRCAWVFDIDYTALGRVDVHLLADGRLVQHVELGHLRPSSDRPLGSRTHSAVLELQPGVDQEIVVRVETSGAMIVPATLSTPAAFHSRALDEQMLQGLLTGLGICLLIYSVVQGIGLREPLFLKYALMISGSILFSLQQFGIGSQYLWTDLVWVESNIGALSALIASTGSFLFIEQVLAGSEGSRLFTRVMKGGAVFSALVAVAFVAGVIDVRAVSAIVSLLGLMPVLLGMPGAVKRAVQGDPVGVSFLAAWAVYFVATAVIIMVINGRAPVNFWTMHSFQIGATVDMLLFMRVLGLRMKAIHTQARHATLERDAMRSLAHSDPLTGLPNRRGLHAALTAVLSSARSDSRVAVYMLDLDGFKPVNDRHGHDVGDELLVAVAQRLQASVRRGDTVARLGGDEFVVMTGQLQRDEDALHLGEQLLAAFAEPFALAQHTCRVGLTIGYALSPTDAVDAVTLLKFADAAMYLGKASGKGCLRRGGVALLRDTTLPLDGTPLQQPAP